jgi:RimJ/RimL family protein N-acetyltransferase
MKIELNEQYLAPTLSSEKIYLRPAVLADYAAIKIYRQDPDNCRYIRPPDSDEETLALVEQLTKPWDLSVGQWNGLVICLRNNDSLVGEIVFRIEDWENQRAEIGYRLTEAAAGKGICTEAAKLLIDYLFMELGFFKIVAKCDPRNISSYRVMEKLRFTREAFFKDHYRIAGEWTDQYDYGLLANNWFKK